MDQIHDRALSAEKIAEQTAPMSDQLAQQRMQPRRLWASAGALLAGFLVVLVLSIGTGTVPTFIRGERLDWGFAQWARPLVSLMISGVEGVADFQCRQLLGRRYFRLDPTFDSAIALDDVRPATLERLVREAERLPLPRVLRWLESHDW